MDYGAGIKDHEHEFEKFYFISMVIAKRNLIQFKFAFVHFYKLYSAPMHSKFENNFICKLNVLTSCIYLYTSLTFLICFVFLQ